MKMANAKIYIMGKIINNGGILLWKKFKEI
jgi:hypothetical protein